MPASSGFKLTYSTMFNPPPQLYARFDAALADFRRDGMGRDHAQWIGGASVGGARHFEVRSPIDQDWLIGRFVEASQPSLISRLAPSNARGAALGVYNTLQSLGLFAGGALGGWLLKGWGPAAVLSGTSALVAVWLLLGWAQYVPPLRSDAASG